MQDDAFIREAAGMAPRARDAAASVRTFNRFYTQRIGVLQERLLRTPFSLAEARVLYELGTREAVIASALSRDLDLDFGYLSRLLRGLEKRRLIHRARSSDDARRRLLSLTVTGRKAFTSLDARSRREIRKMLAGIPPHLGAELLEAMSTIERALSGGTEHASGRIELRGHRPGDMGWVVERHGALYAKEYGWDERFEALVAQIVADFIRNLDPKRERCWIAELDGRRVGSVFLVRKSLRVARLRLLLVEPDARGFGIGTRLVDECIVFARGAGYRRMTLWTNDVLHAARRIYERSGFKLVAEERHEHFGRGLVGQAWDLKL
jgi:DNA-binding MarR family transcriptional regulator/GNAT superfamily N-acetyltransferase